MAKNIVDTPLDIDMKKDAEKVSKMAAENKFSVCMECGPIFSCTPEEHYKAKGHKTFMIDEKTLACKQCGHTFTEKDSTVKLQNVLMAVGKAMAEKMGKLMASLMGAMAGGLGAGMLGAAIEAK